MATISVIVPVYKVEPYLRRCVDSILAQTYTDFELILVDDGSPDNCGKICDEYAAKDNRIKVIHQANGGLSAARNAGIDWSLTHTSDEALTFIDSDDWVEPNYLAKLAEGLSLGAEVACASFAFVEESGHRRPYHPDCNWRVQSPEDYWTAPDAAAFMSVSKLFRRELFGGVRFPVGKLHEDVFTTHKLVFAAKRVASCTNSIYNYFVRSGSITQATWSPRRLDAIDALKEQRQYFATHGFKRAERYARGRLLAEMARNIQLLTGIDSAKASQLEHELKKELQGRKPDFWDTRDYYRIILPHWQFLPRWLISMLWNALLHGKNSWLANESLSMLRLALFDLYHQHAGSIQPKHGTS